MPIWEVTQERQIRWVWRIRADDLEEALRRIREEEEIPEDDELVDESGYELRRVIPAAWPLGWQTIAADVPRSWQGSRESLRCRKCHRFVGQSTKATGFLRARDRRVFR
jgi:hypothetical protein